MNPRINPLAAFQACIPAVVVFLIVDAALERMCQSLTGTSVVSTFEQMRAEPFGPHFHMINLVLFSSEMYLVMLGYGAARHLFASRLWAKIVTSGFFLILISLFVGQMVNLGIYPQMAATILVISSAVALPVSMLVGGAVYDLRVRS